MQSPDEELAGEFSFPSDYRHDENPQFRQICDKRYREDGLPARKTDGHGTGSRKNISLQDSRAI
jgi:hypothetical protein